MKYLLFLLSLLLYYPVLGQDKSDKLIGIYKDHFGSEITINPDSTFKYRWHFDLASSWSNGKWTVKNDTVYLKTILVYDTLKIINKDLLVIAEEETPKRIRSLNATVLSSGGQDREHCPEKVFYYKGILYNITKSGRLIRKKIRGFWINKKFDPMYFKQEVAKKD